MQLSKALLWAYHLWLPKGAISCRICETLTPRQHDDVLHETDICKDCLHQFPKELL
jgi:hypothetical protein